MYPSGHLPPPTTPEEVGARILQMERFVRGEAPVSCVVLKYIPYWKLLILVQNAIEKHYASM